MATVRTTIVSALWVAAKTASQQLANAVVFFWLAFKLSPSELGVASLGVTPAVFTLPLVTRGLRDAVIQRDTPDERVLTTAFCISVGLGVALFLLLAGLSPLLGVVFGDERLPALGAAAALIPLLAALGNLQETLHEREFGYRQITLIYMVAAASASIVAVAVGMLGSAIWTLVAFNLVSYATVTLLFWTMGGWRPRARPDGAEALRLLRFAAPVMFSQLIATGNQRIVEMLAGALLSPAAAAFLRFGGNFTRLLNQVFVTPAIRVLVPAFARSKADPEDNLFRVLSVNAAVLLFVFMMAAAVVPDFVTVVFGAEWETAGTVATALCFAVYAAIIGPVAYPLLVVQERGNWTIALTLAGLVVTVAFVAAGSVFGAVGMAVGFALRGFVTIPMTLWVLRLSLNISPRRVVESFLPFSVSATVVYMVLAFGVGPAISGLPPSAGITLQLVIGTALYAFLLRVCVRRFAPNPYNVLHSVVPGRFRRLL